MFQPKGKSGSFRASSKRPETRTFVPETLRFGGKPKAQVEPPVKKAPAERQSTQPFVPETARFSNLIAVQIGEQPAPVPSQARPTPLPKPNEKSGKKKRDSSLLNMIVPSLGKKSGSAPRPPSRHSVPMDLREPTMDVSETDLSLVESTTHELEMCDLSSVADFRVPEQLQGERYVATEPPPAPQRAKRRVNPWLLWGAVGSAWCAMIGLALLATDGDFMRADKPSAQVVEKAPAALVAALPAQEALHVTAPETAKPAGETAPAPSAPAQEETAVSTDANAASALAGDGEQLQKKKSHHRLRAHKRGGRHGKLTAAQKKKRLKRLRAQRRAAERG
jgi:hypothetical protein